MSEVPLIKRFLQHQSDFMAYLMAITRDLDAAEEIFQNAAVAVIEHATPQEPIRDFRAWAKELVRRQALGYLRRQSARLKHLRPVEPALLEQIDHIFDEETVDDELRQQELTALRDCIQETAEPQRTMLGMRYQQRASFREIGQAVGKTESAAQRALCRLRKALHDCVRYKLVAIRGSHP